MKRILLAGLLGALVVFTWGILSWLVLPWHDVTLHQLPIAEPMLDVMRTNLPSSGVYAFPGHPENGSSEEMAEWREKYQRGPVGLLFYSPQGKDPMSPVPYMIGFLLNFVTATLAAYLLSLTLARTVHYRQRVIFVARLGVFAALVSHIALWNWMFLPVAYTIVMALDLIVGWVLAGLVIAWRIKPVSH